MSKSVENRITALADALRRRQMEQAAPVDPLSASLFELGRELATLDERGKAALLEVSNNPGDGETGGLGLTMEDLEKWIRASTDV